jgi:hypothetical protein
LTTALFSCGQPGSSRTEPSGEAAYDRAAAAPEATVTGADLGSVPSETTVTRAGLTGVPSSTRSIVRRADLDLSVADTDEAAGRITALAERMGGYVDDLSARRRDELVFYELTIRVPTARFGEAMAELKDLASRVETETRSTEDVTDQVVDLEARLQTLRGVEAELRGLLADSRRQNRDVAAIMEIYRQLTEIRTQIEQLVARLANLERETALSAIRVTLSPDAAVRPILADDWRPGQTVREAFAMLVGVLQGLADVAIFTGVFLLPLALLAGVVVLAAGRFLGRRVGPEPTA